MRNFSKCQIIFNHPLIDGKRCIGRLTEIYQAQPGSGQNSRIELRCPKRNVMFKPRCKVKYFINTGLSGIIQELFDKTDPKIYDFKNYDSESFEMHGTHQCLGKKRKCSIRKSRKKRTKVIESPETVPENNSQIIESPEAVPENNFKIKIEKAELLHVFKKQKNGPPYYHFKIGAKKYTYGFVGIQLRDILYNLRF